MHVQAKRTMPEIVASGLRLRPWRTHDAVALVDAVQSSIQSLGRWLPWPRADYGLAEAAAWIEQCQDGWQQDGHFAFAAFDQGTGALLGAAGLNQLNPKHRSGNLGYWVRQSRQGQGIASRTALESHGSASARWRWCASRSSPHPTTTPVDGRRRRSAHDSKRSPASVCGSTDKPRMRPCTA